MDNSRSDILKSRLRASRENTSPVRKFLYDKGLFGYNLMYWVKHPFKLPGMAFEYCKQENLRFYQRGKRGWADVDTWSLDYYLLSWLPEAMKHTVNTSHGYPAYYCDCHDETKCQNSDTHFDGWKADVYEVADALIHYRSLVFPETDDRTEFRRAWNKLGRLLPSLWT